jgi:hypothetical protein
MHRRNILGQCPKTIPSSALEDIRMEKFYAQRNAENFVKVGQSILDLLNEPISRPEFNPKFALHPTQPGQPYDKPLPTTQDYEMQPFLHELLPIMRALDTFNIQAASQLRSMEEEKERMERDGQSKMPLVMRRKRSASDAKLDERPPMKPLISNAQREASASKKSCQFRTGRRRYGSKTTRKWHDVRTFDSAGQSPKHKRRFITFANKWRSNSPESHICIANKRRENAKHESRPTTK